MNALPKISSLAVLCWVVNVTHAQQPAPPPAPADTPAPAPAAKPPKATPQSEAGEPRADTSRAASPQSEAGEPRANTSRSPTPQSEAGEPRAATSKPAGAAGGRANATAGQKAPGSTDRLELGTATVTGDREQPKVMYIVPWKKSDIGDLAGKPMNSLVDEILAPVDRDVFKREVVYYKAVQADTSQNGAPGHPSDQGEK
ncbi:MAG TPA: hypothetical protein VK743_07880 [Steroidobacteraceae bacterium]|jgi:hypothetical protein|nr:hypothetical protein [Steroidobacteraceae bacterium]